MTKLIDYSKPIRIDHLDLSVIDDFISRFPKLTPGYFHFLESEWHWYNSNVLNMDHNFIDHNLLICYIDSVNEVHILFDYFYQKGIPSIEKSFKDSEGGMHEVWLRPPRKPNNSTLVSQYYRMRVS